MERAKSLLPDADLRYIQFLSSEESSALFDELRTLPFKQHNLYYYRNGKESVGKQNRESAWFGEYAQSVQDNSREDGHKQDYVMPNKWTPTMLDLKKRVEAVAQTTFNSCLVGLYHSGRNKMGWHTDCGDSLGSNPYIASLSLGSSRVFALKRQKHNNDGLKKVLINLESGGLLLMLDQVNARYLHSVPPCGTTEPRINLTFRNYKYSKNEQQFPVNGTVGET